MQSSANTLTKGKPLSIAQQRLWVLEQLHAGNLAQNIGLSARWKQEVNRSALERAFADVTRQHEILRAQFHVIDGSPQSTISRGPIGLKTVDLQQFTPADMDARLSSIEQQEISTAFDLANGPLVRAILFSLPKAETSLLLVAHRTICDDASLRIFMRDLHASYKTQLTGQSQENQPTRQLSELASSEAWSSADLEYWRGQLKGAPSSLDLPTDRPRPPVQSFRGAHQHARIDGPLFQQLRALGEPGRTSLLAMLVALLNVLLFRYTRQEDIVIGTHVLGRQHPNFENIIGPLENILALRTDLSGDPSFSDFLARVQKVVDEALAHQELPFEAVLRDLRLERDMSRHPLFQVVLSLRNPVAPWPDMILAEVENSTEQFDLHLEFTESQDSLQAKFSYNTDLFEASTIARIAGHFENLLWSAINDPTIPISRLALLGETERHQLLVEWNDTRVAYPRNTPLHKLIEDQVEKTPESIALVFESEQLTYRELNHRANQLARYLRNHGVGPDVLVAVCAERSMDLVVALLAAMKAGGAYVPLDPEYPKDRLESMLQDANPPVVLAQAHLLDRLPEGTDRVFCLDRDWAALQPESTENLPANCNGKNLAYAIYTSGSTGKPKGVPNVHEGIVNRLLWMQDMYKLTGKDRVLQKTPFSFDVSVWEFFWPLLTGATLVVARPGGHRDPAYLVNLIAEQGITTLHFVPSMLSIFLESAGLERCRSIRQVFASGEALPFELQQRFFQRLNAELHNLYGPTEAAVDVTYWPCRPDSQQSIVPIGRPVANTQIYILDTHLQPVPIGVPGELHIGGIQLARGYLNRPELTAEKFIPDPFSETPGARLYKTGDLARFLPNGNIEYLGRIDFQVKLRGFRIELGEIEAVLGQCSGVLQAVVVVREDHPGDKRLVAYLIASETLDVDALRAELKEKLPEYMVPSRFMVVDKFPMTTSGKVDRKALPAPPVDRGNAPAMVAPRNDLEARLAELFASVLGLPSVGVTDNFFDLGGHSLLAGRLLAQVNELTGRQIPLSALFRGATVESLAGLIHQEAEAHLDPVVMEIQRGTSSRLPFFAIVPPGEESLGYAMLARHMGPQQTVYKIQGHEPVTAGKRPYADDEMQALTEQYVAAMRSVQPQGPYCLGGYCDGTHIAEQIVLKLESEGAEIGLFAVFDTWVLQHSQVRWLWKLYYYGQRIREMRKLSLAERVASYKRVAEKKVKNLVGASTPRKDWQEAYWPEDFTVPRFRAPVVLFKRPKQPFYYIDDPLMGWGERSTGGIETHEVDFHHLHILREPHVRLFGEQLAECIARLTTAPTTSALNREDSLVASSVRQQGA